MGVNPETMTDISFPPGGTLALRARVLSYEVQSLAPGETPVARFIEESGGLGR